jgi:hypothetical protein
MVPQTVSSSEIRDMLWERSLTGMYFLFVPFSEASRPFLSMVLGFGLAWHGMESSFRFRRIMAIFMFGPY